VNKPLKIALGLLAMAMAAAALALPWYTSREADALITSWAARPDDARWALRHLAHQSGWLSSSGTAELQLRSACAQDTGQDKAQEPMALRLRYRINHIPNHLGVNQFSWTLAPAGPSSGTATELTGSGTVGYGGEVRSDMALPELSSRNSWQTLRIAASQGQLRTDGKALALQWTIDDIQWKAGGKALDVQGTHLQLAMDDMQGLTGSMELSVDTAHAASLSLQGMRLRNEVREVAQRLNYQQAFSARRLRWMDKTLSDVTLEGALTGLHAQSMQALAGLWSDNCGAAELAPEQSAVLRKAVRTLLASGFSVGIPSFKARDADASVDASLQLTLRPAAHAEPALAEQLESSGEVVVKGNMLTPEQVQRALQTGYAQEVPGGLKLAYRYAAGALTVSGQSRDASLVPMVLTRFDQALNDALSPKRSDTFPVIEEADTAP